MISARRRLASTDLDYYPLNRLAEAGFGDPAKLPITVKILLEGLVRQADDGRVSETSLRALTRWPESPPKEAEVPYKPSRVLLQDFTGVPAVVDLAAMRSAMQRSGKDAGRIDPLVQVDLVIDQSVQVDAFGSLGAYARNIEREYARNGERYALLRWAQQAFHNFTVVPPGMGICHQVNLERLSRVVQVRKDDKGSYALPDTLLGTDSHTTMVNGLGVLGWGVGGIEAEAALLGQPTYLPIPVVVGVRMTGALRPGATATDLVLTLTERLRKHGVVNKFVEFCGSGLSTLSVPDRATLSNMCPEYGATSSLFPVDAQTLRYLETTGRDRGHGAPGPAGPQRLSRHRGHHQLYQHLESVGDGGRRPAGQAGRRARAESGADGQDQPGAGLAGGHRLPEGGRADALPRGAGLLPRRLRVHDLHRQQRPFGQ